MNANVATYLLNVEIRSSLLNSQFSPFLCFLVATKIMNLKMDVHLLYMHTYVWCFI